MKIDKIDLKILKTLQANARISNVELADAVGLSPSPCLRRVRQLEQAHVINRYVTLVEPASVGLTVNVFVQVSLERQGGDYLNRFEEAVGQWPEVMECYLMSGDADYHLRVVVPDLAAYEHFLHARLTQVPGISNIKSSFALKRVNYRTELPLQPKTSVKPSERD